MGGSNTKLAEVHVAIIGGNFAGTALAKQLEKRGLKVTLIEVSRNLNAYPNFFSVSKISSHRRR